MVRHTLIVNIFCLGFGFLGIGSLGFGSEDQTISKHFDLNGDGKSDLKIYFNKAFTTSLIDADQDGIVDQLRWDGPKQSVEYLIRAGRLRLINYSEAQRVILEYSKQKSSSFVLVGGRIVKLSRQFFGGSDICTSNNETSKKYSVDLSASSSVLRATQETCLKNLGMVDCSEEQKKSVNQILLQISDQMVDQNHVRTMVHSCLKGKNTEAEGALFPKIIAKLEGIKSGTSPMTMNCGINGQKACEDFKASSFPYPDHVQFCFNPGPQKTSTNVLSGQLVLHEILHSKTLELNENQIGVFFECLAKVNSPILSAPAAQQRSIAAATQIAENGVDFNPGAEYQHLTEPPLPSQATLQNAFVAENENSYGGSRVAANDPVVRQSQAFGPYVSSFFSTIPQANADEVKPQRSATNRAPSQNKDRRGQEDVESSGRSQQTLLSSHRTGLGGTDLLGSEEPRPSEVSAGKRLSATPERSVTLVRESDPGLANHQDAATGSRSKGGALSNTQTQNQISVETKGQRQLASTTGVAREVRGSVEGNHSGRSGVSSSESQGSSGQELSAEELERTIENHPSDEVVEWIGESKYKKALAQAGITVYFRTADPSKKRILGAPRNKTKRVYSEDRGGIMRRLDRGAIAGDSEDN